MPLPRLALVLASALVLVPAAPGQPPATRDGHGDPLPAGALVRMGTTRWRPGSLVRSLVFAPDGKFLCSAGVDGVLRLWDVPTGKELHRFDVLGQGANAFRFTDAGKTLTLVHADETIRVYELATGKELRRTLGPPHHLLQFALAPDGKTLAVLHQENTLSLWDAVLGKELGKLFEQPRLANMPQPDFLALGLAYAPDGKTLAVAGQHKDQKRVVRLLDVASGKEVRSLTLKDKDKAGVDIRALAFSPDGTILVARSDLGATVLWDLAAGKELRALNRQGPFGSPVVSIAQNGKTLVCADGDSVHVEETATGRNLREIPTGHHGLTALALSPDGKQVATSGFNHVICLWDLATGKEVQPAAGHQALLVHSALSPDGRTLAAVDSAHTVRLWNAATGQELRSLSRSRPAKVVDPFEDTDLLVTFLREGQAVAAVWQDGAVLLWDAATGKELRRGEPAENPNPCALAVSPGGAVLAVLEHTGMLYLRDLATGKELLRVRAYRVETAAGAGVPDLGGLAVVFSPDGKTVLTSGADIATTMLRGERGRPALRLWEVATGKQRGQVSFQPERGDPRWGGRGPTRISRYFDLLEDDDFFLDSGVNQAVFAPDGAGVALQLGDAVVLWDLIHDRESRRFGVPHGVGSFAFAPNGRLLVIGACDGSVNLWDPTRGTMLGRGAGHRGAVTSVVFRADGRQFVTTGLDTTALVWDVAALLRALAPGDKELSRPQLESLWKALASPDAAQAYQALRELTAAPPYSLPLLRERLRPEAPLEAARIAKLIADLDSAVFAARQQAVEELAKLGTAAEQALRRALHANPSLEARQRIELLLDKLRGPVTSLEQLRQSRALEVLERIGGADARQVLEGLAKGAPDAPLTRAAREALERVAKRIPTHP